MKCAEPAHMATILQKIENVKVPAVYKFGKRLGKVENNLENSVKDSFYFMYTSYLHKNWQSMVRIRVGCYMNNDIQPLF
jgi:hypothetical protein